jgi:predicted HTH domain antitoxin
MIIEIPDDILQKAHYSEIELRLDFLTLLYQKHVLTLARAARLAGFTRLDFQKALAERSIPIHYSIEDIEMDLKHLKDLNL